MSEKNVLDRIDHRSKLITLTPFIDGNGILRVKGRLENSTLTYDEIHPIILPPFAHLTQLLIDRAHLRSLHGGTGLVTSLLRRQYWREMLYDSVSKNVSCASANEPKPHSN